MYSPDESADYFAFAQVHSERKEIDTVPDKTRLADDGLFSGRESDNKATLL